MKLLSKRIPSPGGSVFSNVDVKTPFLYQGVLSAVLIAAIMLSAVITVEASPHRDKIISFEAQPGYFALSIDGTPVPLYISDQDHPGVIRAYRDLQADIERVTHNQPDLHIGEIPNTDRIIIAGTVGLSPVIDRLSDEGAIDISGLEGKWEKFHIEVVSNPVEGVGEALVIVGSDRRGTTFGIYEMSKQIGVSPWHWWADVPVVHQSDIYVSPERYTIGEPGVQYRGIFINNENPGLLGWVVTRYGWFTHEFYEHVFELILRLQGNYLWPAMWGKAFHDDDPMNPKLADEYGVVIGYSHHEPMMRAHIEWSRYGEGPWDYSQNEERLREFWTEGI
ncbi:glycosyl hydrolase 115 family protein, partial [Balneolaceae bacterium ANBcel3]|nr:glycosyl hydrolase 115 family protein [Balneolaceae bacterium ANBcel3]